MKWILFALQILPAILEAVKAVEAAVSGDKQGALKHDLVLAAVLAGERAITDGKMASAEDQREPLNIASKLITSSVDILNTAGVFQHGK